MFFFSVLVAQAATPCVSDACIGPRGGDGVAFEGVSLLLDVSFGRSRSLSASGGAPTLLPKAAIGLVFASDVDGVGRYPVFTPYLGFGPALWDGGMDAWALYAGAHVLGFGDVGWAGAIHPRTAADLSARAAREPDPTQALCLLYVEDWRGPLEGDEAIAHATWQEAWARVPGAPVAAPPIEVVEVWGATPEVDVWGVAPTEPASPWGAEPSAPASPWGAEPSGPWGAAAEEWPPVAATEGPEASASAVAPILAMPRATSEGLRAACYDGHAAAVIELVDRYEATFADRPATATWAPRRDSFVYAGISPLTGVRALMRANE